MTMLLDKAGVSYLLLGHIYPADVEQADKLPAGSREKQEAVNKIFARFASDLTKPNTPSYSRIVQTALAFGMAQFGDDFSIEKGKIKADFSTKKEAVTEIQNIILGTPDPDLAFDLDEWFDIQDAIHESHKNNSVIQPNKGRALSSFQQNHTTDLVENNTYTTIISPLSNTVTDNSVVLDAQDHHDNELNEPQKKRHYLKNDSVRSKGSKRLKLAAVSLVTFGVATFGGAKLSQSEKHFSFLHNKTDTTNKAKTELAEKPNIDTAGVSKNNSAMPETPLAVQKTKKTGSNSHKTPIIKVSVDSAAEEGGDIGELADEPPVSTTQATPQPAPVASVTATSHADVSTDEPEKHVRPLSYVAPKTEANTAFIDAFRKSYKNKDESTFTGDDDNRYLSFQDNDWEDLLTRMGIDIPRGFKTLPVHERLRIGKNLLHDYTMQQRPTDIDPDEPVTGYEVGQAIHNAVVAMKHGDEPTAAAVPETDNASLGTTAKVTDDKPLQPGEVRDVVLTADNQVLGVDPVSGNLVGDIQTVVPIDDVSPDSVATDPKPIVRHTENVKAGDIHVDWSKIKSKDALYNVVSAFDAKGYTASYTDHSNDSTHTIKPDDIKGDQTLLNQVRNGDGSVSFMSSDSMVTTTLKKDVYTFDYHGAKDDDLQKYNALVEPVHIAVKQLKKNGYKSIDFRGRKPSKELVAATMDAALKQGMQINWETLKGADQAFVTEMKEEFEKERKQLAIIRHRTREEELIANKELTGRSVLATTKPVTQPKLYQVKPL